MLRKFLFLVSAESARRVAGRSILHFVLKISSSKCYNNTTQVILFNNKYFMECKKCQKELEDTTICDKCAGVENFGNIEFFSITTTRLAVLSIITFGVYEIYWFYRNWRAVKNGEKLNIQPFWRAVFSIFFCHSLFKKILQSAKKYGFTNRYSPGLLAILYIILILLGNGMGNGMGRADISNFGFDVLWLLVSISTIIPLISIQKAINFNNSKITGNSGVDGKFSKGEVVLIIIGSIFFLLVILGILSDLIPQ